MKRLARILRGVLTALSLLLLIAVCGVWVRGYWRAEQFELTRELMNESEWRQSIYQIEWGGGDLAFNIDLSRAKAAEAEVIPPGSRYATRHRTREPAPLSQFWAENADSLQPYVVVGH